MGHGPWDVQLRLQPGQSCWKNRYVYSHAPIMIHNDCTYINICIYMYKITLYSNDIPIKRISNIYEHPHDIQSIKIKLWLVLSLYIYMIILTIPMIFSLYIYILIYIYLFYLSIIYSHHIPKGIGPSPLRPLTASCRISCTTYEELPAPVSCEITWYNPYLVGGFNLSEKYESQCSKPPTR